MNEINDFLLLHAIPFQRNVDLKTKTWIRRGGIAKIWIQPDNMDKFKDLIVWLQKHKIAFEIIGSSSNCYFLSDYFPDIVISILKLNGFREGQDAIVCDCGYLMSRLAKHCNSNGISGYEGFIGLPGTVAGAAINNAGCYGSLTENIITEVGIIQNGVVKKLTKEELAYSHRSSSLKRKEIEAVVFFVSFDITQKGDATELEQRAIEFQKHRKTFQEHSYPNLGTVFCELELKRTFYKKGINFLLIRLCQLFIRDKQKQKRYFVKIFWLLYPVAGSWKQYVSEYGIRCFTWKDEGADEAFKQYVEFMQKQALKITMEIEIKGEPEK